MTETSAVYWRAQAEALAATAARRAELLHLTSLRTAAEQAYLQSGNRGPEEREALIEALRAEQQAARA